MEQNTERAPAFFLRAGAAAADAAILFVLFYAASAVCIAVAGGTQALEADPSLERPFIRITALVLTAVSALYFTLFTGKDGQTPGKKLAVIKVVTMEGTRVGYAKAFVRWVGYQLAAGTFGAGFLLAKFTQHQRGLQDFCAGTRVVVCGGIGQWRKAALATTGVLAAAALSVGAILLLSEIVLSFLR